MGQGKTAKRSLRSVSIAGTPIRKPGSFGHFFHEFGLLVFFLPTAVPSDILGDVSRVPT